jgi:hypothetical protein
LSLILALAYSFLGLQWEGLIAMIRMAKHNNPGKAGKYPETREGLLALEELDLSNCKLTGIAPT